MSIDQREFPRIPLSIQVRYTAFGDFVIDYTGNISLGGCFIENKEGLSLQEGQEFDLVLMLPILNEDRSDEVHARAIVRWVSTQSTNPGVGVQFTLQDEDQAKISQLISHWEKNRV